MKKKECMVNWIIYTWAILIKHVYILKYRCTVIKPNFKYNKHHDKDTMIVFTYKIHLLAYVKIQIDSIK